MKNHCPVKFIFVLFLSFVLTSHAQTIVTIPVFPIDSDSCTITFDASKGNAALKDVAPPIYAHTGVITNLSASSTDWKHVIAGWSDNLPKAQMIPLGNNIYQIKIKPDIRAWYGVPTGETILKLAFVFRNADGSKIGREADGSDIFADVYNAETSINIIQPFNKSLFLYINTDIPVKAVSPLAKTMKLYVDNYLIKTISGTTITDTIQANNSGSNWKKLWVKIVATNDTASVADSFCYTIIPPPSIAELPEGIIDGINYLMDSTKVVLCLYAPKKNNCFVLGDFNNWQEDSIHYMKMTPDSNRFWIKVENLVPGTEYIFQYLVDGSIRIADPYCDKVSDPDDQDISPSTYPGLLHYPSDKTKEIASYLQTSQLPFSWNENLFIPPDITDLVIYELLIRDFIGDHDYPTLIDTLPYLKKLGINAVELMPVMEFEGNSSWGYNPDFMFAPDKYYGTKNGLKQFIEAAHSNGIAVILDIVLNHQFGKSPLVRLYWDVPSNTVAANSPWFNQIPMHPYNVGFDFNHESPDTRAFCKRVFQYWLTEYHVDGFRLDMSKGFTQKNSYPDNVGLWGQYDASRINILQDYQSAIRTVKPNAYVILEHFADNSEEKVLSASGMMLWGNMNYSYNEAAMGWNSGSGSDFSGVSYRERGWSNTNLVGYMESHDEERLMFKNISYGNSQATYNVKDTVTALDRIQLGATFFFTVPGPKMIYEFEETGFDYSINSNGGRLAPKPIRWDYQSWWPRKYLFNVFSSLINLKKNLPVFKASDFSLDVSGPLKKIHLQSAGMNAAILGNFDVVQQSITPAFQQSGTWYDYFSGDSISVINTTDNLTFQPGEYHIYTTVKLNKPLFTGMDETLLPFSTGKDISVVYPNPSSNHFNIVVKINKPSGIFIDFYNWSGEKIFRITENSCNIGTHLITWDGSNFEGKRVPSGIYLYRVTVENKSEIKKLILE